jgi:sterol desaturase/sphingolipid hydroxylase (fatty acid hydroxylase superfamily)
MATFIVQVVVVVLGLLAGWAWPREHAARLPTRATLLNLVNGGLLFAVKVGVTALVPALSVDALTGAVPLSRVGGPFVQFLVAFLLLDLARYALHVAHHRVEFLWSFHKVHHCAESIDATTGFRMHLVDFVQLAALPLVMFGVLFETSVASGTPAWVLPAVLSVGIVADAIEHANVPFPLDTWWRRAWFRVFNTPIFHAWHHTRDGHLLDGNYANALPLWDRLFGTEVTRPEPPALYGVRETHTLEETLTGWWLLRPRPRAAVATSGSAAPGVDARSVPPNAASARAEG